MPKGLRGEEIPLLARIISIAESYDRILNKLEHSQYLDRAMAVHSIKEKAGTQFDQHLVNLFLKIIEMSS